MKTLKSIFLFIVILSMNSFAQDPPDGGALKPPKYPDGIYTKENTRTRRAIPYTTLREADVMWSKRVWRAIDLKEKINHPLYYPEVPSNDRKSLFDVIKEAAITNGTLSCFDDGGEIEFQKELTKSEIEAKLESWDSTHQVDDINNPGTMITAPLKNTIKSSDIQMYWVKEDWFFDKQRSVLDVRIIGIMILQAKKAEGSGDIIGKKPLFSFYFPEARPIFANAEVYMRHNDAERRTFDDIFWKRMFSSYILKETNVYDRYIGAYTSGLDALLESERVKNDIFNFEHDMWHF
jgi:gliding motility associated protien GldN